MHQLSDEECREAVAVLEHHGGNNTFAAAALGLARSTMLNRIRQAARRGFMGTDYVLPGFEIKQTSSDGEKTWVQQRPERGEKFEVLPSHSINKVSALVDGADERVIQKWVMTNKDKSSTEDIIKHLQEVFDAYKGYAKLPPVPKHVDSNLATIYNLADHHLGMFSWARETGEEYDIKVAERLLLNSMAGLVTNGPGAGTAVVLNLGDFFHADNMTNRTLQSGNELDTDTRYAKVLQLGVKLQIQCIEMALQKHKRVIVRCLPGNHDPHTSLALTVALAAFFDGNPRVEVDTDPSMFFWWRFGKVFIGATHGHLVKPDAMPGVMAARRSQDWGATEFRYAYLGHVHHKSRGGGEANGVIWETFQSLAAKDAWHHTQGYSSGRSMTAITHHKDRGEVCRHTVVVPTQRKVT